MNRIIKFRGWDNIKNGVKEYFLGKLRGWVSESIGYNLILLASEIRMLKADISCMKGLHDWESWSATLCGNVKEIREIEPNHYSYRACNHCRAEMPESRIYHGIGTREKNALDFTPLNRISTSKNHI